MSVRTGSYTSQGELDADGAIDRVLLSEAGVAGCVAAQNGSLLNAFNGQYCALFPSAPAAYRAARAIIEHPDCLPMGCGIHAGQIYRRDGRIFSSAIGTASRICGYGRIGQIVLSDAVSGLIRPHLGDGFALMALDHPSRGTTEDLYVVVERDEVARATRQAFISYRREGGAHVARLVSSGLRQLGVKTFLDVDDLQAAHFDEQLLDRIGSMANFVPILTPGCFDRAADPGDWMRREIVHAIATDRRIVPLLVEGFRMPAASALPSEMSDVVRHQGVTYSHELGREALTRLAGLLRTDGG